MPTNITPRATANSHHSHRSRTPAARSSSCPRREDAANKATTSQTCFPAPQYINLFLRFPQSSKDLTRENPPSRGPSFVRPTSQFADENAAIDLQTRRRHGASDEILKVWISI